MIRHKDLKFMDYNLLVDKIAEDLGIEIDINISSADKEYFKNKSSEVLFNSLNQEDKDFIGKHFPLDKEIYDDDSLFWAGKAYPRRLMGINFALLLVCHAQRSKKLQ